MFVPPFLANFVKGFLPKFVRGGGANKQHNFGSFLKGARYADVNFEFVHWHVLPFWFLHGGQIFWTPPGIILFIFLSTTLGVDRWFWGHPPHLKGQTGQFYYRRRIFVPHVAGNPNCVAHPPALPLTNFWYKSLHKVWSQVQELQRKIPRCSLKCRSKM